MKPHTAYISVGSNIGDKWSHCLAGMSSLENSGAARIVARSSFYKTEPVDYRQQDWFVNAVFRVETMVSPLELFERLKSIEVLQGRDAKPVRFGPRILDLDIVLYDALVLDSSVLTIPHPRMHLRRFVLKPICDIAAQIMHPVLHKSMRQLLDELPHGEQKVELYR